MKLTLYIESLGIENFEVGSGKKKKLISMNVVTLTGAVDNAALKTVLDAAKNRNLEVEIKDK